MIPQCQTHTHTKQNPQRSLNNVGLAGIGGPSLDYSGHNQGGGGSSGSLPIQLQFRTNSVLEDIRSVCWLFMDWGWRGMVMHCVDRFEFGHTMLYILTASSTPTLESTQARSARRRGCGRERGQRRWEHRWGWCYH